MRAASASRPLHTGDQRGQAGRSESSDGGHDEAGVGELRYAESQLLIEGFLALPQFAGWSVLRPKSCFLGSAERPETDITGDSTTASTQSSSQWASPTRRSTT